MNQATGILIMMNNYLHDVATAVLLVSAVTLFTFAGRVGRAADDAGVRKFFVGAYRQLTKLMGVSLAWIIAGGIVRTLAFMKYEWLPAAGRGQTPALVLKHIVIFAALGCGVYYWLKVRVLVSGMRSEK